MDLDGHMFWRVLTPSCDIRRLYRLYLSLPYDHHQHLRSCEAFPHLRLRSDKPQVSSDRLTPLGRHADVVMLKS